MFNQIWGRELNVLNLKVEMKCSIKYECENEMFNEIWVDN